MASGRDRVRQQMLTPPKLPPEEAQQAKVTALGPPVQVSWQGGTYSFPHLSSYTAVVNDLVALVRYGGSWLIIGKPVDFP